MKYGWFNTLDTNLRASQLQPVQAYDRGKSREGEEENIETKSFVENVFRLRSRFRKSLILNVYSN